MLRHAVALAVLALTVAIGCDESSQPPASDPPPADKQPETVALEPSVAPSEPAPVEPAEPPAPVGGPHCDQTATQSMCIDYTDHRGVAAPRCFANVELGEGPCPSEGMIAKCSLPTTGVTLVYYESKGLDAANQICAAVDGTFEPR